MNNRNPVYALNNPNARIISVPNNLWRVQIAKDTKGTREQDNWQHRSHPISRSEALVALAAHNKKKGEASS